MIFAKAEETANEEGGGSCSCGTAESPLSPTQKRAEQVITADGELKQRITILVSAGGFDPSSVAMERNIPATILFRTGSLNERNYRVSFPEYNTGIELMENSDSIVTLVPDLDFTFTTWKGDWGGWVFVDNGTDPLTVPARSESVSPSFLPG